MAAEIDFQPYLHSISTHYEQWWELYTLTDAQTQAKQKDEPQPWKTPFDFGLMVQTVQRDRSLGSDGPEFESQSSKEKIERFPVLEGIRKFVKEHRQVLLVGRPGSGKSTTLARLLLEEALAATGTEEDPPNPLKKGEQEVAEDSGGASTHVERQVKVPLFKGDLGGSKDPGDSTSPIPVLVELRFLSNSTILDRIQAFFQRHDLLLDRTQIEDLLFHRRLLLLMDGLNELPSEAARQDVAKFRQDYPKVSIIFTTRDLSLGGDFGLEKKLEMQPLTEAQMQAFVRSYVPEQSEAMLRQLKERLREFGQTPLLLWMLCGLFRQTGQIPANLGEVFRAFTQGYEKNLKADVPVESDRRWWPELLQELAFWMMRGVAFGEEAPAVDVEFRAAISKMEARQIFTAFLQNKETHAEGVAQKYLDDLLRHHLIQPNGEQVEFRHQLLQEYYAAEYLLSHCEQLSELEFKRDYINYLKWTEAISLMLGLTDNENLTLRVVDSALKLDLMLGARLAGKAKSELQSTTVGRVIKIKGPQWFKIELLRKTQSDEAIPSLCEVLEDENSSSWFNAVVALGNLRPDQAISRLLNTLERGSFHERLHSVPALEEIGSAQAISGLLKALTLKHTDSSVYSAIHDSTVRLNAAASLGRVGAKQAIPNLLKALEDEDSSVREKSAEALGRIGSEQVIPNLLKALEDEDSDVREKSAEALGKLGSQKAVLILLNALEDEDSTVRLNAAASLGTIESEQAIPSLLKALKDEDFYVRAMSAEALGRIGSQKVIQDLLKAFDDEFLYVRRKVTTAIGKLGSEKAILGLLTILEDYNFEVRWEAVDAIGKLGSGKAIPKLLRMLKDENSLMRWNVAVALGNLGSDQAIPELLNSIENKDSSYSPDMRRRAVEALGKQASEQAILGLLKALEDKYSDVYMSAVNALGNIKNFDISHVLPQLVTLIPTQSGIAVFRAMLAIQSNCKFYNYDITQTTQSMKLFFSYAHKDEPLRDQLATHLSLLKRQNIITDWHDRNITAGTDWAQAIDHNLNTANIILLLISSDFLASDYCWTKEMEPALVRHNQGTARIIPIILRPCDWQSAPFGNLQALPIAHSGGAKPVTQWSDQDEAFTNIAQGIRKAVAELQQRKSSPATHQTKAASSQAANVTMNFYGPVHGAAGTVQGDQNIQP
jgi:HEAT repeat protein/energy-coupling factor transporter ATP-binding protein EcfA2